MSDHPHIGSSLENFLIEEGRLEEATNTAIKRVLIWQLQEATKEQGLSKAALAARMGTSRTQIDRLLDPDNTRVTLHSLATRRILPRAPAQARTRVRCTAAACT